MYNKNYACAYVRVWYAQCIVVVIQIYPLLTVACVLEFN